jgi:hypothetical protein
MLRSGAALAVDVISVSNSDDQDHQTIVLNLANDPEIARAISPQFPETGALKSFPDAARIFQFCNSFLKKFQDTSGMLGIKFGQFAVCLL